MVCDYFRLILLILLIVLYVSYTELTLQIAGIPNSVFSDQANTLCQYTPGKIVII